MTENDYLFLPKLKRRSDKGKHSRHPLAISVDDTLVNAVSQVVPFGKGKYGSAFIELATWLLIAMLTSGEDIESVAKDLKAISASPYLIPNLTRLLRILQS